MKDFDGWNERKKNLDSKALQRLYKERDIWWCSLGLNVGREHNGTSANFLRPILIIKGLSKNICLIAPITTSKKSHFYRISLGFVTGVESKVVLSQIRVIDTKRLVEKINTLDKANFETIKKSLRDFL
jgi:mRNA interferase MazF